MITQNFRQWRAEVLAQTELALNKALPEKNLAPNVLHQAMREAVLSPGKRIRALLVHAAGRCSSASTTALDAIACALEMVHAYSLVHDDLPAMDDANWRRGQPALHKTHGEGMAILVGDALQTQAFICLAQADLHAELKLHLVRELALAISSAGMAGGQALDLLQENLDIVCLDNIAYLKTGALIRAALRMGLSCSDKVPLQALDRYAHFIGLGFQMVDDILDISHDLQATADTRQNKSPVKAPVNYVSILGAEEAKRQVKNLHEAALKELQILQGLPIYYLTELTHDLMTRVA